MTPLLDTLRERLLPLPGVEEDIKWKTNYCFLIGGRIFAIVDIDPQSLGRLTLPTDPDERDALLENPRVGPAPYLGRAGWVTLAPDACPMQELVRLAEEARLRIARRLSKKKQRELGLAPE